MPKLKHINTTHRFKKVPTFMEQVGEFIAGCIGLVMIFGVIYALVS